MTITGARGRVTVTARVDTGCRLFDPLSGVPVMVCEKRPLRPCCPMGLKSGPSGM